MNVLRYSLVLFLCAVAGLASACPKTECVRVGSWNIKWLGSEHRSQPSDPQTITAMANLIADKWSLDIVTLQEINTTLDGEIRGQQYSLQSWNGLKKALEARGYQTYSGSSGYAQQVVMAWRAPVSIIRSPFELGLPEKYELGEFCRTSNMRKPLAGLFRAGQFDFWLVGLHLKAATGETRCSAAIREQQNQELVKEIKKLHKADLDVILAGDFNASQQHKTLAPLLENSFHPLHHPKLRNPQSNRYSYRSENAKKDSRGSLIDHVMVSSRHTKEWLPYTAMIYQPEDTQSFALTYSDHLPIWVDFSTLTDDD
jgi:endonuclease/exonuclease/phosphatase family metal-dependent hydrolase